VGRYDYTAFGALKSQIGIHVSRFTFSSKERDTSTGFSYYGYRFYSPQWQRWVSGDYIQESGGVNLYAFVFNAPNGLVDADGSEGTPTNPQPSVPWIPPFPSHPASCDKNRTGVSSCSGNAPPACPAKPPKPCSEKDFNKTRNQEPAGTETKDCPGYGRITVNCFTFEKCLFWAQPLNGPTLYGWQKVRDCPCPKPPETKK
jgi:RHS repeat-associated protein